MPARLALRLVAPALLVSVATALPAQQLPNQGPNDPVIPRTPATTPAGGDTTGYWQQRADYSIHAVLDEARGAVRATGTLRYYNASPDTLRELWFHQHLNAFRPGSRWSAVDEREGRSRFQQLADPDYAYERLTRAPVVNGRVLRAEYPLAPDSSVFRIALSEPVLPGATATVEFAWEARPSTLPRRQGRGGRSYDFAQWYPRVAVYDRHGWKPNALVPAGEFYGEFGNFDVTFWLPEDQVIAATGVPVAGDPGWARVAAPGHVPVYRREVYTPGPGARTSGRIPERYRELRFRAEGVHHFGWSVSPDFVYEGGVYVRRARAPRSGLAMWDTVAVHALYRGDADAFCAGASNLQSCITAARDGWQDGAAVRNVQSTLAWLEEVFGDYPYPQMTTLRRIEGGGTEFPMLMMNGSNSAGLVTHEGAHIFAHGLLANNEWQSGWLDEGLASYITSWQSGTVRPLLAARLATAAGVTGSAASPDAATDSAALRARARADFLTEQRRVQVAQGNLDPMATRADAFRSFSHYNTAVYTRAQEMYAALHDLLGDAAFRAFLRDYFSRWAFRHVDRWAMQASAERVSDRSLEWFFDQWTEHVGVIAYTLDEARADSTAEGWRTTLRLRRTGDYRHDIPIGIQTAEGWTMLRADAAADEATLTVYTSARPLAVELDPFGAVELVRPGNRRVELP